MNEVDFRKRAEFRVELQNAETIFDLRDIAFDLFEQKEQLQKEVQQLRNALELIAYGSLGVDKNGMFIQPYEVAHKALKEVNYIIYKEK